MSLMKGEDEIPTQLKQEQASVAQTSEVQTQELTRPELRLDWAALRQRSLAPGGFGEDRAWLWPKLLHADEDAEEHACTEVEEKPHEDERQIGLDTDRSFVLYPVDENMTDRAQRQRALHALIVQVFRRHPGLSYFQGYHDIITVLLLTLPEHAQLRAAERLSLQRLRDSMGRTLEPLVGLLRVLQRLLRLADPAYAALLEEQAPLPYPALSHLLTLFAHDVPTLPLAQHVFDFLFVRPPIAAVYLAAAVMLARRDEVVKLGEDGEEGMIHSVLTGLPELVDRDEGEDEGDDGDGDVKNRSAVEITDPSVKDDEDAALLPAEAKPEENVMVLPPRESSAADTGSLNTENMPQTAQETALTPTDASPSPTDGGAASTSAAQTPPPPSHTQNDASTPMLAQPEDGALTSVDAQQSSPPADKSESHVPSPSSPGTPSPPDFGDPPVLPDLIHAHGERAPHNIPLPPSRDASESRSRSRRLPSPVRSRATDSRSYSRGGNSHSYSRAGDSRSYSRPAFRPDSPPPPARPAHSLPALLRHADALMARFPPSHPALELDKTMGPASVVHTWSEDPAALPSDAEAEALAVRGVDVVLREPEPTPEPSSSSDASASEDEKAWFGVRRRRRRRSAGKDKDETQETGKERRRGRRLHKHRRPVYGAPRVERRTLLAGAALVLGVAMAASVYGMHARAGGGGGAEGELRKVGKMVGALVSLGGRLFGGADGFGL